LRHWTGNDRLELIGARIETQFLAEDAPTGSEPTPDEQLG